jgi:uncharacterized protein GlcG (DUF336 family)
MTYQKVQLALAQAQAAMAAMLEKATREADRPVAIAIVNDEGVLLSYASMDNCRPIPRNIASKKAYTAAVSGSDAGVFGQFLKSNGMSTTELGDANLLGAQGGVTVVRPGDGMVLGGIGVSGLSAEEDEELARLGVAAMGL